LVNSQKGFIDRRTCNGSKSCSQQTTLQRSIASDVHRFATCWSDVKRLACNRWAVRTAARTRCDRATRVVHFGVMLGLGRVLPHLSIAGLQLHPRARDEWAPQPFWLKVQVGRKRQRWPFCSWRADFETNAMRVRAGAHARASRVVCAQRTCQKWLCRSCDQPQGCCARINMAVLVFAGGAESVFVRVHEVFAFPFCCKNELRCMYVYACFVSMLSCGMYGNTFCWMVFLVCM
jgi:hypothetical protein